MDVRALVLTGLGINCDLETAYAFRCVGAEANRIHVNDVIDTPALLDEHHILAVPGGFSFGDNVASGKILANRLRFRLQGPLEEFVAAGKLIIGICNGFQVLVKMGLLPLFEGRFVQETTLINNDRSRFENRWVTLRPGAGTRCVWLSGIDTLEAPVRHGEGKFVVRDDSVLERLKRNGQVALRYVQRGGAPADGAFPWNPNGSVDDIAGICDPTGRVFGLMPHPEAFLDRLNHPRWTRDGSAAPSKKTEGDGMKVFENAVRFVTAQGDVETSAAITP